jgi:hypothetical protein
MPQRILRKSFDIPSHLLKYAAALMQYLLPAFLLLGERAPLPGRD